MKNTIQSQQNKQKNNQNNINKTRLSLRFEIISGQSNRQLEHISQIYAKSFVKLNSLWKKLSPKYEQIYSVVLGKMIACRNKGQILVMIQEEKNKIVTIGANMDLLDYLRMQSMPSKSEFLRILGSYGQELQRDHFQSLKNKIKRGQVIFTVGAAVDEQMAKLNITKKFWALGLTYYRCIGYKFLYARSTNRVTTKLMVYYGGKILKRVNISENGVEGQFMQLIMVDLQNLKANLSQIMQQRGPQDDDWLQNH